MEDERIVPALVSVYKAEAWQHLGFCGNLGSAACRVPYEKPSRWAVVTLRGCSFLSCWGRFVQFGRCIFISPPYSYCTKSGSITLNITGTDYCKCRSQCVLVKYIVFIYLFIDKICIWWCDLNDSFPKKYILFLK